VIALLLALAVAAPPAAPAPPAPLPRVTLRTALGEVVVEVDLARAPVSGRNFLRYVDAGRYRGGAFHRTVTTSPDNQPSNRVKIDVIQAGPAPGADFPPIALERTRDTGLILIGNPLELAGGAVEEAAAGQRRECPIGERVQIGRAHV